MSIYDKGLVTVLAVHALFVALALPLMLRRVPPNVVYGYRTRKTLSDEALWYEANAYFGGRFIIATLVASLAFLWVTLAGDFGPDAFMTCSVVALGAPVAIAGVLTGWFAKSLG